MFELGICRKCGAEYLVGALHASRFEQAPPFAVLTHLLLERDATSATADDEDEQAADASSEAVVDRRWLCLTCGLLAESAEDACECTEDSQNARVAVVLASRAKNAD